MDRSVNEDIVNELKKKIKLYDFVFIQSNTNVKPPKFEKVEQITKSYYYTKSHKFLISSLLCVDRGHEDLKITDFKTNIKFRVFNKLEKDLKFKCISIKDDHRVFQLYKNNADIDIIVWYGKGCKIIILVNHITVYIGFIESIDEFNIMYKTTIKHLL